MISRTNLPSGVVLLRALAIGSVQGVGCRWLGFRAPDFLKGNWKSFGYEGELAKVLQGNDLSVIHFVKREQEVERLYDR